MFVFFFSLLSQAELAMSDCDDVWVLLQSTKREEKNIKIIKRKTSAGGHNEEKKEKKIVSLLENEIN